MKFEICTSTPSIHVFRRGLWLCPAILLALIFEWPPGAFTGTPRSRVLNAADANQAKKGKDDSQKLKKKTPPKRGPAEPANDDEADDDGPITPPPPVEYETVKLADGTEIQTEKWGETFEGYDYRAPVELDDPKIREIVSYEKRGPGAINSLHVDPEGQRLYWSYEFGDRSVGHIATANIDGKNIKYLVEGLARPRHLVVDVDRRRMFWLEGVQFAHSLKTADLDGKNVKVLVPSLNVPFGLALDRLRGELYYWEQPDRIIRIGVDGKDEQQFVGGVPQTQGTIFQMQWNPKDDRLYWVKGTKHFSRADRDGSGTQQRFSIGDMGDFRDFVIDPLTEKLYFSNNDYEQVLRSNLDGSEREILVTTWNRSRNGGDAYRGIAGPVVVDRANRHLYWRGSRYVGAAAFNTICVMKLPPRLRKHTRPAPPRITAIVPSEVRANDTVTVTGNYLTDSKAVTFVDDSNSVHVPAKFQIMDDKSLSVTLPKLSQQCTHPLMVVETPGGVTFTVRKKLTVVRPKAAHNHNAFNSGGLPQLWLTAGAGAGNVESAVVYADRSSQCVTGPRGHNTIFAKNGSVIGVQWAKDMELYHEPFILMPRIQEKESTVKMHSVPAIRPSFVESGLSYSQ